MKESLQHKLDIFITYLPVVGILAMAASMIHSFSMFQRIAMIVAYVGLIADIVVHSYWKQWKWSTDKWIWISMISVFLLIPLWWVLGIETSHRIGHDMEVFLSFILIGFIGLIGWGKTLKKEWLAVVMLSTTIIFDIWALVHIDITHLFNNIHLSTNVFNAYRDIHINSHMAYAIYVNTALVFGFSVLKSNAHKWLKYLIGSEMLAVIPCLWLTDGRVGFFTMLLMVTIMIIYFLRPFCRKWMALIVPLIVVAAAVCLIEMVQHRKTSLQHNPRIAIWNVSMDLIKERPILGYGSRTGHEIFVQHCVNDKDVQAAYLSYYIKEYGEDKIDDIHPHNAFLEQTTAFGIVGLIVLLFACTSPLLLIKKCPLEIWMLILIFLSQAMFEKMGSSIQPCLFLLSLLVLTRSIRFDHL